MPPDHMCPGDRAKWRARREEEAASFANRTSDAIRRTSEARARLGELVEAARSYSWRCGHCGLDVAMGACPGCGMGAPGGARGFVPDIFDCPGGGPHEPEPVNRHWARCTKCGDASFPISAEAANGRIVPPRYADERMPQWTPLRPDAPVERAWLAVDTEGCRE